MIGLRRWSRGFVLVLATLACSWSAALESAPRGPASSAGAGIATLLTPPSVDARRDFDGDGIVDQSRIASRNRVSVQLSSTSAVVTLPASRRLVGLASVDIDRDGDLDLVAFLDDGGSVVWINDGHGVFARATPRPPAPAPDAVSAQTWIASIPLAPLGISGWHLAWLPRPPSVAVSSRLVERAIVDTSTPRRRVIRYQPDRAPPFISL